MRETRGRGQAALVEGNIELGKRDAALLRAIARTGSVAKAATDLGRSRARALSRIDTLEDAFGELVTRQRGGSGGGGSQLTENGTAILNRYGRLQAALTATAQVPETVLNGTITAVAGELASVDTAVGTVRGLHEGLTVAEAVQVRIGADAVTIHDPDTDLKPDTTSALNRLPGTISGTIPGETVLTVCLDVDETTFQALVTDDSATRLGLREDTDVILSWKATATRLVRETPR
jgi:molybdate transport system regulatory protein